MITEERKKIFNDSLNNIFNKTITKNKNNFELTRFNCQTELYNSNTQYIKKQVTLVAFFFVDKNQKI